MNSLKLAPACLLVLSLSCLAGDRVVPYPSTDRVVSNPSYELSADAIRKFSEEANKGSGDAAMKLSDHYFYLLPKGKIAQMQRKSLDWALIGAENGHPRSMYRAYQLMAVSDQRSMQIRSLFWLQQAAKNGDEDGARELEVCSDLAGKRPSDIP